MFTFTSLIVWMLISSALTVVGIYTEDNYEIPGCVNVFITILAILSWSIAVYVFLRLTGLVTI